MSDITDKLLKSGLIDQATASLMEKWGSLPAGSTELVREGVLERMTKRELESLAESIAVSVEREVKLKETQLDLDKMRWPVTAISIRGRPKGDPELPINSRRFIKGGLTAMVDRMGRYYFRIQDVKEEWFVPGSVMETPVEGGLKTETIADSQVLYVGDEKVCIQVSVL
jgi:hypothetical protein